MFRYVPFAPERTRSLLRRFAACYAVLAAGIVLFDLTGCGRSEPTTSKPRSVAAAKEQTAASCQTCHADVHAAWSHTDHARANRMIDVAHDAEALTLFFPPVVVGPGKPPQMVLGNKPLWQPLIMEKDGRWQPHELAYDPARKEWFSVFGDEQRETGEWGHWTGRGMNWNSLCAQCHMTGYKKNYNAALDAYRSTWVEQGVSCVQCHGPMPEKHGKGAQPRAVPFHHDRQRMMQTCAPCHARNEALTDTFQPGDVYADHYRVILPTDPGVFYPDGQQRDEDFNWTSVQLSRMGHAGVTCMDCHDPHTTKTILPVANNQLCLQCHAAPGREQPNGTRAVSIDPMAHSHHAEGSAGNSCVACHMPTTNYMMRAPRHDHGWLKPDPLLTKELGIPNACSKCHTNQTLEWNIAKADEWYGDKLDSRQRARARAVAAAQTGKEDSVEHLLALLEVEDIPAWRATFLSLLIPGNNNPAVLNAGRKGLSATDPVERAAAVRLLTGTHGSDDLLRPLLQDPVRLVRLDTEWALSHELAPDSPARKELDTYMALSLDQPAGRMRLGQDLANRGDLIGALKEIEIAQKWDEFSPGIRAAHAQVLTVLGRPAEAGAEYRRAAELASEDYMLSMNAALAFAEAGNLTDAESAFRIAVKRNPAFDRAWYNLGLLLAQTGRQPEAVEALRHAMNLAPAVADYPYALATVLLQIGDIIGARSAAQRVLNLTPNHSGARQILKNLR
jgi:predicted CXXCH cytochrome family protein